jgi:DME family drug/metabolite transporter
LIMDPSAPGDGMIERVRLHAGLIAVVAAAALWGLGGTVAGSLFANGADPLEVVAVRTWVSVGGLILISLWRGRGVPAKRPPLYPTLGFGISVAVANAALFMAIDRLTVAVALVLQNLAPAFVVAWVAFGARRLPALRATIGLGAALAGVAFVVELPSTPLSGLDFSGIAWGLLTAAAVAAFSAFGGQAARECDALTATTWAFMISGVLWLVYQLTQGVPAIFQSPALLLGATGVGALGTLLPFLLFSWGTAQVGATVGAINISLEPIFGAALAWSWLGQRLTVSQLAGACVLLVALIDVQRTGRPDPGAGPAPTKDLPRRSPAESVT